MKRTDRARAQLPHTSPAWKQQMGQRIRWRRTMHPFQAHPRGDWLGWMLQAGRGAGKTQTGAQDAVEYSLDHRGSRYAVVAPTWPDARDVCIEGESGVLSVLDGMGLRSGRDYTWNRSHGELHLRPSASRIDIYTAEKPDRLRGPQHNRAWCDEAAAWKDAYLGDSLNTAFNNLLLGLRLGDDPRVLITTTPRRVKLVTDLIERDDFVVSRGTTYDNLKNLAPTFAETILRYEGTTIGRQEILGEIVTDVEGALWTTAAIDDDRLPAVTPDELVRVVVGVDPQGSLAGTTGIVAASVAADPCLCHTVLGRPRDERTHFYVLDDASTSATPLGWGRRTIATYDTWGADRVLGEPNFGGDMVESNIRTVDPDVSYKDVHASRGKVQRAEPIAALYEQHRVHHIGGLADLESEMTTWTQEDPWSPNRIDALVWALTELSGEWAGTPTVRAPSGSLGVGWPR
jgi:phage terminase large subunit-like protein